MKNRLLFTFYTFLLLLSSMSATATTHEFHLNNGLKLIVREDHRSPTVVSQVWYKVGSCYESTGLTGISHALEHMMFKGTNDYSNNYFSRLITEKGGRENAFTSYDFTTYHQVINSNELALLFRYESDRMHNLALKEEDFVTEKNVVKEERLWRVEDNPNSLARESFYSAAYPASTYSQPVIGWMSDIESLTVQDLNNWYQKWYSPNNAILVVVGDVNPNEVYNLAKTHFGPIKSKPIPSAINPRKALPVLGNRRVEVVQPAKVPHLFIGYNVPSIHTALAPHIAPTLEVLAAILDAGDSARLSKELLRDKAVATFAGAGYSPFTIHATLFELQAVPTGKISLNQLEQSVLTLLEELKTTPVTKAELEKTKLQLIAQKTYDKDSMFNQAYEIGSLEASGYSWKQADEYLNELQNVTPEQIMAVAQQFFVSERQTIAHLVPPQSPSNSKEQA